MKTEIDSLSFKSTGHVLEIDEKTNKIKRVNYYDDKGNEQRLTFKEFEKQEPQKAKILLKLQKGLQNGKKTNN